MSTRRLFLPAPAGEPIWIYGGPNNGSIWQIILLPDDTIVILGADQYWQQAPGVYVGFGNGSRSFATSDPVIMPPGVATEAQAMAMVVTPGNVVNGSLLGTFVSPNNPTGLLVPIGTVLGVSQYASLPTSAVVISISGVPHLLVAGLFSYYLKASHAYTANGIAAIDMTTGLLNTGFMAALITPNASFPFLTVFPLKVFSDGAGGFGLYSIGGGTQVGAAPITELIYQFSFAAQLPSGVGSFINVAGGSITPPIASYGSTAFNAPFTIDVAGALVAAFSSSAMPICRPCKIGTGVYLQASIVSRPDPDPATSGSLVGATLVGGGGGGTTFTVNVSMTTGLPMPITVFCQGGTTGKGTSFTVPVPALPTDPTDPTSCVAAITALFPECTFTFTSGGVGGILSASIVFTMPASATYLPAISDEYKFFTGSGWSKVIHGGVVGFSSTLLWLAASDGSYNEYFQDPQNVGTGSWLSADMANNGTVTCFAICWINPALQWTIKLIGGLVINIGLVGATASNGFGKNSCVGLTAICPVSVVPFNGGFAISLPYLPKYGFAGGGGTAGAPVGYAANTAAASAATVLLKCPIIVINAAGVIDTAFDAALWTNFFSLARTDGARFGSMSLATDSSGNLYFGSMYVPDYFDVTATAITQTDNIGNVTPVPSEAVPPGPGLISSAFSSAGSGLEVLCACDTTGAIVLPP